MNVLAMPDSAVARYKIVIAQKDSLIARRDSIRTALNKNNALLDSLKAILPATIIPVTDSSGTLEQTELPVAQSDTSTVIAVTDTLAEVIINESITNKPLPIP